MSKAQEAEMLEQGAVVYGDGPGEVCPRRQGQGQAQPVQADPEPRQGVTFSVDDLPGSPLYQPPVRQARSLRPKYKILIELTVLSDQDPEPKAHWLPGHYRKPESAEIDASAVFEDDYLPMLGAIGHVAVVEMTPGERPRLHSVRHFPEE